jgi:alkanesulfonate monooxygenase SsuD/methylene tetrahydromethanopterin reductase-like flavin-dependent oxidoreductase (luciferase family)
VDVGIGLGNTLLDMEGRTLVEWAKRAEARGFSSLATIGRIAWPGYDELVALSAAAAVTTEIELLTNVLLAPAFGTAQLAKATASVDRISEGRLTLGLGVGARPDDYEAAGQDMSTRGRRFDEQLAELHEAWAGKPPSGAGQPFGPAAVRGRVPLLIGGEPQLAGPRAARWNAGFTIGGAPPDAAAEAIPAFRAAYERAGGTGDPRVVCLTYFSVGDAHTAESLHNLRSYYATLGEWSERIAQSAARGTEEIRSRARAFRDIGADELVFSPTVPNVDQVDGLADAVLGVEGTVDA